MREKGKRGLGEEARDGERVGGRERGRESAGGAAATDNPP